MFYRITKVQYLPGRKAQNLGAVYCCVLQEGLQALGLQLAQFKAVGNSGMLAYHCRASNVHYTIEAFGPGQVVHHGTPNAPIYNRRR